jgi:hypothetical protein
MRETRLRGRFILNNTAFLQEKAERKHDPRHRFYEAILASDTYEDYYDRVGGLKVHPATFRRGPVTAHMEIQYARARGWIADR